MKWKKGNGKYHAKSGKYHLAWSDVLRGKTVRKFWAYYSNGGVDKLIAVSTDRKVVNDACDKHKWRLSHGATN